MGTVGSVQHELSQTFWRIAHVDKSDANPANHRVALWAVTPYRDSEFDTTANRTPATNEYNGSLIHTRLVSDFNTHIPPAIRNNFQPIGTNHDNLVPTTDIVWLPSEPEVDNSGTWGFGTTDAAARPFRTYNHAGFNSVFSTTFAWLRSPGAAGLARRVVTNGNLGSSPVTLETAVRPALYLTLSSLTAAQAAGSNTAQNTSLLNSTGGFNNDIGNVVSQLITNNDKRTPFRLFPEITTADVNVQHLTRTLWRIAHVDTNHVTLYAETAYRSSEFDTTANRNPATNEYNGSLVQNRLKTDFAAITTAIPTLITNNIVLPANTSSDNLDPDDLIWLPSETEVVSTWNLNTNLRRAYNGGYAPTNASLAWLRSPGTTGNARYVDPNGNLFSNSVTLAFAVRPALHLTLSSLQSLPCSVCSNTPCTCPQPPRQVTTQAGTRAFLSIPAQTPAETNYKYQWYTNSTATTTGGTPIPKATKHIYVTQQLSAGTHYYYIEITSAIDPPLPTRKVLFIVTVL